MTHSTEKQIAYLGSLARAGGFASNIDAINAYGFGLRSANSLSISEASQVIDWLKNGGKPIVAQKPAIEEGTEISHQGRSGRVITTLNDGRCIVKFSDGEAAFLAERNAENSRYGDRYAMVTDAEFLIAQTKQMLEADYDE